MKTETRMDVLLQRLADMNGLVDLTSTSEEVEALEAAEQAKKKKKGSGERDGFFSTAIREVFFRGDRDKRPGILGITHPSDGHPQEELTPDFGWFRALSHNNATWTLYWPELII